MFSFHIYIQPFAQFTDWFIFCFWCLNVTIGKLDSERMIGQGTPSQDITYLSLPEKEFLFFIAYFPQNLHFFIHLNFEFPSMMDADLTLVS